MRSLPPYERRIIDDELDELSVGLSTIALEGPKGVGKTRTALQRANTVHRLDDPAILALTEADPSRLLHGDPPILIDEWQRYPPCWDLVRRADDEGAPPGRFLLTGSAVPRPPPTHSGAGRIVSLRMRPMSMAERIPGQSVRLADLLTGSRPPLEGRTGVTLAGYADEIVASGLPGVRRLSGRSHRAQLDGYLTRIVDRDVPDETGATIRSPAAMRRWMAAYAAATATTTSWEKIRDAATPGHDRRPAKETAIAYRDALARIWMLDEIEAWLPGGSALRELGQAPKHQLADPALAVRLLGLGTAALLAGTSTDPPVFRSGPPLGALFGSLVALSMKVYAAHNEAAVHHLRIARGRQEVDLIVVRPDGGVVAIEVKLTRVVDDDHVTHLRWLAEKLGDRLLDGIVVTPGPVAYRRPDGIGVVPFALLGP
jgi:predicted AAA+ superfamily ATPase